MLTAETRVPTEHAKKYLEQMCKHFAHKIDGEQTEDDGRCALPTGPAVMRAEDGALWVRVEAQDAEALARAEHIISSHLLRFAFREKLGEPEWTERATAD